MRTAHIISIGSESFCDLNPHLLQAGSLHRAMAIQRWFSNFLIFAKPPWIRDSTQESTYAWVSAPEKSNLSSSSWRRYQHQGDVSSPPTQMNCLTATPVMEKREEIVRRRLHL
jgi:hypothetical protein